eukprot:160800-Rhodomonas_salina.1
MTPVHSQAALRTRATRVMQALSYKCLAVLDIPLDAADDVGQQAARQLRIVVRSTLAQMRNGTKQAATQIQGSPSVTQHDAHDFWQHIMQSMTVRTGFSGSSRSYWRG